MTAVSALKYVAFSYSDYAMFIVTLAASILSLTGYTYYSIHVNVQLHSGKTCHHVSLS